MQTRRLTLTPLAPEHAPLLHPLLDDWEVVRMLAAVPWPVSLADVEQHAREHAAGRSEADEFAVLLRGTPIGVGSVKRPGTGNPARTMPRLGYWLGRRYWGRGLATEMAAALVAHAFHTYAGERVGAGSFADNPGSRRVLEKLGFHRSGGRSSACVARGAEVATDDMHLLRVDWLAQGRRA